MHAAAPWWSVAQCCVVCPNVVCEIAARLRHFIGGMVQDIFLYEPGGRFRLSASRRAAAEGKGGYLPLVKDFLWLCAAAIFLLDHSPSVLIVLLVSERNNSIFRSLTR